MSSTKALIVNADDFGLTEGVNRGIVQAYQEGIVTSTSLIANGRAFNHAILLAKENEGLKVGLHLTLVEEQPVAKRSEVPSLIGKDGTFYRSYLSLLTRLVTWRIKLHDVRQEFRAQVEKCLAAGIIPTHLDSHQHIHILPGVLDIVIELAKEYGIPAARCSDEKAVITRDMRLIFSVRNVQRWAMSLLAGRARTKFKHGGILTPDNFCGMLSSGRLDSKIITVILRRLPPGTTELACHPGLLDAELACRYSHWGYNWEGELAALTDPSIIGLIKRLDIKLTDFSHLASGQ